MNPIISRYSLYIWYHRFWCLIPIFVLPYAWCFSLSLSLPPSPFARTISGSPHTHTYIYIYAYCWLFSYFPLYSNKIRGSEIPIQLVGDVGWAQIHQLQRPANSKDCRMVFVASHTPAVTWTRKPAMLKFLGISSLHLGCISSWKWLASVYLHIMLAPD